ncbi:MAG: hypothetical protein AB7V46_15900 [Thermomicrobiales bacterium]
MGIVRNSDQVCCLLVALTITFLGSSCAETGGSTPAVATDPLPHFEILSDVTQPPIKRMVTVRLDEPVDEETLGRLASDIHGSESGQYERTFITYLLPGMVDGAGAWATTHFNPDLEVRIVGFTVELQQQLIADSAAIEEETRQEDAGRSRQEILEREHVRSQELRDLQRLDQEASVILERVERGIDRGSLDGRDGSLESIIERFPGTRSAARAAELLEMHFPQNE